MKLMTPFLSGMFFCLLALAGCGSAGVGSGGTGGVAAETSSWASLGVAGASRQITLSWTKTATKTTGSGTASYTIYWSTAPGVSKQNGNRIANAVSPFTHSGLTNGVTYYYVVTETIAGNEGPESLEVATTPQPALPPVPSGVSVAPLNGAAQIKIDRTGAATTTKFNLYWSRTADFRTPTRVADAFGSGAVFQHTGLTNGTIYYYAVSAEGPEGESPLSATVAATPLADIPAANYQVNSSQAGIAAPTALTAAAANQRVTLSWNMPASQIPTVFDPSATPAQTPVISGYTVYWSTSFITDLARANKIAVPVTAKTKPPLTFTHNTGLTNGTAYYYLITAVADADANGVSLKTADGRPLTFESPVSSQIMVTPSAKAPATPTGFSATSGAQQVKLSWTKGTAAATTYAVYASTTAPARPEELVNAANRIATTSAVTYLHSGLHNGAVYYYTVTANTEGESAPAPVVAVLLR